MEEGKRIIGSEDLILVTGATGFIGPALIESLLRQGFRNLRAFARPSSDTARLTAITDRYRNTTRLEVLRGNLLSEEDCMEAAKGVAVAFHLATSASKSFPDAFMNSVITTRNLLEASRHYATLRRFVNISSLAVYSNTQQRPLDESAPIQERVLGDAYAFGKIKQDEIVREYGDRCGIPYVIVRPGPVYGPGKASITGRVGVDTFGIFLHLGGPSLLPLTYVDNCADAMVLAGVKPGVEGEIFNIVDDNLPSSRRFLRFYKRNAVRFPSIYLPHCMSYALCWLWESYSHWSEAQLPPAFNRNRWRIEWKKTRYSNAKAKAKLGWTPRIPMAEGLLRYFKDCREELHA
jgi:nucleoside-diphosphate-sugar epimerase